MHQPHALLHHMGRFMQQYLLALLRIRIIFPFGHMDLIAPGKGGLSDGIQVFVFKHLYAFHGHTKLIAHLLSHLSRECFRRKPFLIS